MFCAQLNKYDDKRNVLTDDVHHWELNEYVINSAAVKDDGDSTCQTRYS